MAASVIIMLAAAFLAVMLLGAMIVYRIEERNRKHSDVAIAESRSENTTLKQLFVKYNSSKNSQTVELSNMVAFDLFIKSMQKTFGDKLSMVSSTCSIELDEEEASSKSCSIIFGVETPKGTSLITMYTSMLSYLNWRNKLPAYELAYENVTDYIVNKEINVGRMIKISSPIDDNQVISEVTRLIQNSTLSWINYPEEEESSEISYYMLTKNKGDVQLQQQTRKIRAIKPELLKSSYSDLKVEYDGKAFEIPMDKGAQILANVFAKNGENIAIFGKMGTGKTHLADEIARQVSVNHGIIAIYVTPAMVAQLQSVDYMSALVSQLEYISQIQGREVKPVFIIDEAEQLLQSTGNIHSEIASYMLSVMDGIMQKVLNCSFILTFNCEKSLLNAAAFRKGRMGIEVNLDYISLEKAEKTIEELKFFNQGLQFEEEKWAEMKKANNQFPLADIYNCFTQKSRRRVIGGILRELGFEGTEVKSAPPKIVAPPSMQIKEGPTSSAVPIHPPKTAGNPHKPKWNGKHKGRG